jgi:hypothetical protein
MSLIKFTTDQTVRKLRWVMGGALLFDTVNTLLGQSSSYWQHPDTANEGTPFFRFFLSHSWSAYLLLDVVYLSGFLFVVSIIPRNAALVVAFSFILGHYYGASTWLIHRWDFGMAGPIVYGVVLSAIIVGLVLPTPTQTNPESLSINDEEA